MLSRFPTTFDLSTGQDGPRTVDINGHVWQRSYNQRNAPVLLTETKSEPACASISNNAKLLAYANPDGSVAVIEIDTNRVRLSDLSKTDRTVSIGFSPSDNLLAGVTVTGLVRIWDTQSGDLLVEFRVQGGPVQTIAFSSDGHQLAIATHSQEIQLKQLRSDLPGAESQLGKIDTTGRVTGLAFTPDNKQLVIGIADGTLLVQELEAGGERTTLGSQPFAIWTIAFEPNTERMATGSWDGTIKLWDVNSWELLQSVKAHQESVAAIRFDDRRGMVSAGLDGRLLYWPPDLRSVPASAMISGRPESVWAAVYSPSGDRLFVGGREQRFELWDTTNNRLTFSGAGHPTTRCATFSPDGEVLATGGDDRTIVLTDSRTGEKLATLPGHRGAVSALIFTADGQTLISACDGGDVRLWNIRAKTAKSVWREHRQQIYAAGISPDGKWLVTGGGNWLSGDPGELIVWDLGKGTLRARVLGHGLAVWTVVFSPDGQRFASSDSTGAVKIWNTETLEEERTLQHSMWVRPLAISPDGRTLAVGRGDGAVRLWDTATWTQKATCAGHASFTFWLQYSPSGETLISGGEDGTVRFWRPED